MMFTALIVVLATWYIAGSLVCLCWSYSITRRKRIRFLMLGALAFALFAPIMGLIGGRIFPPRPVRQGAFAGLVMMSEPLLRRILTRLSRERRARLVYRLLIAMGVQTEWETVKGTLEGPMEVPVDVLIGVLCGRPELLLTFLEAQLRRAASEEMCDCDSCRMMREKLYMVMTSPEPTRTNQPQKIFVAPPPSSAQH